jgi:hypothetical protein
MADPQSSIHSLDYLALVSYLLVIVWIGFHFSQSAGCSRACERVLATPPWSLIEGRATPKVPQDPHISYTGWLEAI